MTHDEPVRSNKGFHPILDRPHPYTFIDACMQAWPDADFANAHRHGVDAIAITAFRPHAEVADALEGIMFWHAIARRYPNTLVALRGDDVRDAKRDGRLAMIMAAQGGDFIGRKLHRVEAFHKLGLRMLLFAYNATNALSDGALDTTTSGLSRFGVAVVGECNRLGVLIDGTHVGTRATLQLIEESADPITFSHSNADAVSSSPRNISDEQIRACVARGGVIGLAPFGPLVMKRGTTHWPTLSDFLDHLDHVVQLTGTTASVGIGTDMSLGTYEIHPADPWGDLGYPDIGAHYGAHVTSDRRSPKRALSDFNSYAHVWRLIDALGARGYSDADVAAIMGGNYLRLFDTVWR